MIVGFTFIKNAVKYDYPFTECLQSLRSVCNETWVAHGDSDDATADLLPKASDVRVIEAVWDPGLRKGGEILSQQTNLVLSEVRKVHAKGWGLYLQGDEVLADWEVEGLKKDLAKAEAEGCDAVSFRYFHFWRSFRRLAYAKRWYPQEIRAVRLDRPIESFGDAQSFRGHTKVFYSDVTIWHYGHIREPAAYEKKKNEFHRLWHKDEDIPQVIARGEASDAHEPTLAYWGPHPKWMASRIARLEQGQVKIPEPKGPFWVVGALPGELEALKSRCSLELRPATLREAFRIPASQIVWMRTPGGLFGLLQRLVRPTGVPCKMKSPQARPWPQEILSVLRFSERGVALRQ